MCSVMNASNQSNPGQDEVAEESLDSLQLEPSHNYEKPSQAPCMETTPPTDKPDVPSNKKLHHHFSDSHADSILKALDQQRQNGLNTDVILCSQGMQFPCHKALLSASSPFFQDKFETSANLKTSEEQGSCDVELEAIKPVFGRVEEYQVVLNQVDPVALKTIIDFVYTGCIDVSVDSAPDLILAATDLAYPGVISACCDILQKTLSSTSCLPIAKLAQRYSFSALYQEAWAYALLHFHNVICEDSFLNMSAEQLEDYIGDDNLNVRCEDEVFHTVLTWVKHQEEERLGLLPKLLRKVHLPLLSNNIIQDSLENSNIIKASQECIGLLKDADNMKDLARKEKELGNVKLKPRPSTYSEIVAVVGGMQTNRSWSKDIVFYDPSRKEWNHLATLPFQTTDYSVSAMDTSIFVTGGYKRDADEPTGEVWKFDTLREEWDQLGKLNVPRFNHTSTTVDGSLYVIGGENDTVGIIELERYDPETSSWEVLGKTNEMESNITAVGIDNKLFITGWLVHPRQTCVTQSFDLETGECLVLPCSSLHRQIFPTVLLHGRIYLLGASRIKEVSTYDPVSYKLTRVEPMRYKRNSPSAAVVGGKIYVTGGELRHHLDKGEVFDPSTGLWSGIPPMPSGLCFHGCVGVLKYLGPPFFEPSPKGSVESDAAGDAGSAVEEICNLEIA